jgi:prepilin-type N-terminal cleavage/methylation domain-containing protein
MFNTRTSDRESIRRHDVGRREGRLVRVPPCQSSSAFTLIELISVIFIMAIMSTFAVLSVTRLLKSREVTTGTQVLAATLKHTQQSAIVRGVRARTVFLPYKDVSGMSLVFMTNAVQVMVQETMLSPELHKDGWIWDPAYREPKLLGRNVVAGLTGPNAPMRLFAIQVRSTPSFKDNNNANQSGIDVLELISIGGFPGATATGPILGWSTYPYVEFDSLGRATSTATCTVMSVASTNVAINNSKGTMSGTIQGNFSRVIVNKGETRIIVE